MNKIEEISTIQTSWMNACCRALLCERIKLVVATGVVFTLLLVVFAGVALHYSVLASPAPVNFVLLFGAVILLAYLESLHFAVVSIEKWDMNAFGERFPRAAKCHKLVDTPAKVKQFLVGRQFFVIFVVFLIAQITSFPGMPSNFAGLPPVLILIVLQTGLPGVALTLTFGQLIGQIYTEEFTLQFMNMYGCEFVIRLSLFAEFIGVCNFSWLLLGIASRVFCQRIRKIQKTLRNAPAGHLVLPSNTTSDEEILESPTEKIRGPNFDTGLHTNQPLGIFDYFKYVWSTGVTLGSVAIILYGISIQSYVLPTPVASAYIIAICTLTVLFFLEGLMIAIVGTQYWDPEMFREIYPRAYKIHLLVNQPENVKRFIIGRQFFTVLTNFLLAQIFTFANWKPGSLNKAIFYIGVQSGLCGVFVILSFAQLLPELLAAEFPLRFMNMYGSYSVVSISLLFDNIGIGHCGWAIYYVTRKLFCSKHMDNESVLSTDKPAIVHVNSAEVMAVKSPSGKSLPSGSTKRLPQV